VIEENLYAGDVRDLGAEIRSRAARLHAGFLALVVAFHNQEVIAIQLGLDQVDLEAIRHRDDRAGIQLPSQPVVRGLVDVANGHRLFPF
jgi:hypothetical protein